MKRIIGFALLGVICWGATWASSLQDPAWISGELDNGFRYFIRENAEPKGRLELRLVVNAGSILEDEDQQGLAHYLEHMAFNGTENFEKDALVAFLESLGVAFGPDLNAYTSFDETVYMLKLPTDDPEVVEKAFLVLSDWAGGIVADDEAIEAERGVIIEEWRGRRGASARIRDLQYPLLFKDSRYAERLPIGKLEILEDFDFQRLRDFYQDWYRPELMSIIAVGDLDVESTEEKIQNLFSDLEGPEEPRERIAYQHPPAESLRTGIFTDPEVTSSQISLVWNLPPETVETVESYLEIEKEGVVTGMLNQRFAEIAQQPEAPFLQAGSYAGGFTRAGNVFMLYAAVKDEEGAVTEGGEALMLELERAKQFGFTQSELDRAIARRLSSAERAAAEKETTPSAALAREMVRHALENEIVLGPERELEKLQEVLPSVTLEEVSSILTGWLDTENQVIMVQGPEHEEGNNMPEESELEDILSAAQGVELTPYEDELADAELISESPAPGEIVTRSEREDLGLLTWELSNGVTVMVKPTDFKQDEVRISAWSPGGMNTASDEEWIHAKMAASTASATGLGDFSAIDLGKVLAGKQVSMNPYIQMDQEGIQAEASPKDLETLFQLIYLRFTTVREDADAFAAMKNRLRESLRNRDSDPKRVYEDLFSASLNNFHPRLLPTTLEDVEEMDQAASLAFFQERFANAGDFTFFIVGNVELDALESLVTTWLGSLPAQEEEEEAAHLKTDFPEYHLERWISKGVEPISEVRMVWTSEEFEWNYASRHAIQSMVAALRRRLREDLREDKGGTYHVSVFPRLTHYPEPRKQLIIRFGCDPDRVEELMAEVHAVVEELQTDLLDDSYIEIVQQTQLRRRETDLRENSFWEFVIPYYNWHGEDPGILLEFENFVDGITAESIRETANEVFDTPHFSTFVLLPEADIEQMQE